MDFFPKLKISKPFSERSRMAGSCEPHYARLGNFATAWVRGRAASHRQPPVASAVPPARTARGKAAAAAAARAAEQSARPPPSDKRRHQSRSGLGEGLVLGGGTKAEGAGGGWGGGVQPPGPTCQPRLAPALQGVSLNNHPHLRSCPRPKAAGEDALPVPAPRSADSTSRSVPPLAQLVLWNFQSLGVP